MNLIDRSLQRLLKAASSSRDPVPESPSPALVQRVLAHWRSATDEDEFALAGLYRQAAICALIVMTFSAGWTWFQSRSEATGVAALTNYALTIQEPP